MLALAFARGACGKDTGCGCRLADFGFGVEFGAACGALRHAGQTTMPAYPADPREHGAAFDAEPCIVGGLLLARVAVHGP